MKITQTEFTKIIIPTVDIVRNRYIVESLVNYGSQVLMIGQSGVGKTVLADIVLSGLDHLTSSFTINLSAGTTSNAV
jgi:dynein heavy chain